jgi:hypothetical protein
LPRTRVVLVDAAKIDQRPVSARRTGLRTVLGRFKARNRPAGSSSRAVARLLDGVGAGRYATGGSRSGGQALRLRFFRGVHAGSWSLGAARLPRAWGAPTFARRGSVLATAQGRTTNGVLYAGRFQIFTPLGSLTFFRLQETLLVASAPLIKAQQPPDCGSTAPLQRCTSSERLRVARPRLNEVLRCCQKSLKFGKDAVSTIRRCETSPSPRYASSSHASSARSVNPCKCAAAQVVPPPRWATTKPPKDY